MTTPKLRFKEFDGCWVQKIISEIADVRGGKRLPKGYSLQEENNGFPYITVTDMENGTVNLEKIRYVPLEVIDQIKRYRISVDEIYISVAGTLGLVGIIPQELNNANLTENADKLTNIKCNQFYLLHYLNNGSLSKLIDSVSTIGAQPKLALYAIQGMPIFLPSLDEQTKISSFLSAVDEKISQLSQKHQLLSQYKQGMMQKLFSQQIRFKADDGSEFGEWEEKQLGEIIKFVNGKGHENDVDSDGSYTLINSKFLSTNGSVAKKVNKCNQKVMNDSLVMVMSDVPNGKALAKVMYIQDGSNFALNQRIGMFIFHKDHYPKFFQYQLNRHQYYLAFDSGVGQTNLKKEDVLNCPILVPCIEEQTTIANFLSAIDQKIEVVTQQIEQAKQWKKGLLQQMFV